MRDQEDEGGNEPFPDRSDRQGRYESYDDIQADEGGDEVKHRKTVLQTEALVPDWGCRKIQMREAYRQSIILHRSFTESYEAGGQGYPGLVSGILPVAHFFQPLDVCSVHIAGNGEMCHGTAGSGAMPVFDTGRAADDIARFDDDDRFAPFLRQSLARDDQQGLSGRMGMPCRSCAALEGYIGAGCR